jgi:Lon protease-like protein
MTRILGGRRAAHPPQAWCVDGYGDRKSDTLPKFPLNTVLFPGTSVPLRVFEDRYRALVHHLLRVEDPTERIFGSVGIREGYEVGEHGAQWLFRVGCRVKMTEVEAHTDGTFDLVAVGLDRIELEHLDISGTYPVGQVTPLTEQDVIVPDAVAGTARATFEAYRAALVENDREPPGGDLPHDPAYLSWTLAAMAPLTLAQRQALLEAEDAHSRLRMVTEVLRAELRTMQVIPSLPATEIARTRWSPN